jgi:choline-sulfatase
VRFLYIDIDTLRPDHLGCYGYHRNTSPNIDAVAAKGVRFTGVHASDTPCLPSRSALISGQFGIHNGIVGHGGSAAELFPEGASRGFWSRMALQSWARQFRNIGWKTSTISTFAERHAAYHWLAGFNQNINVGLGGMETADLVTPEMLGWIDRNAAADNWFCHVHIWDPHTPYRTPAEFGDPFASDPIPAWYTEEVRAKHWDLPGPHSAQEMIGFGPAAHYSPFPRQPREATDLDQARRMFDGYDTGVRYADEHVGRWLNALADAGVLDDTAIMISSDHGETLGELGTYCDHHFADEHTTHLPLILHWPGVTGAEGGKVADGLHYQLDVAATVLDLAGGRPAKSWDGQSFADELKTDVAPAGREKLIVSHGAWTAQRAVRTKDWLYMRSYHDGFHGFDDEMLFNITDDPHEEHNVAADNPALVAENADALSSWRDDCLASSTTGIDPFDVVVEEGGPWHVRGRLLEYAGRLRETGRGGWADSLLERYPREATGELPRSGF